MSDHDAGGQTVAEILESDLTATKNALDIPRGQLDKRLERITMNRDILLRWIKAELVEAVDFGSFHMYSMKTKTKCNRGDQCTVPWHWSKPALQKPGAEKIAALLGLRPHFPDLEEIARSIIARIPEAVVIRCQLLNSHGHIVGEGIGGREIKAAYEVNKALKMAKKSALIDAVLITAGLSELFTQDFGDQDEASNTTSDMMVTAEVVPVGPLKGHAWETVPDQYLQQIREHTDVEDSIKEIAKQEIERREEEGITITEMPEPDATEASPMMTMREAAEAINRAATFEQLERTWNDVPERFQTALRKSYERMRAAFTEADDE